MVEAPPASAGLLRDAAAARVLERLHAANTETLRTQLMRNPDPSTWSGDPQEFAEIPLSVSAELGNLMYLLARAANARNVVDFATSFGTSTIYLAAAVRDNGGGKVFGSEIVPSKVAAARRHLAEAGLEEFVEIREGDARETLRDLGAPIDFALVDGFQSTDGGWLPADGPSLAMSVLEVLLPQLGPHAILVNDNGEPDYLDHVRDPGNGFRSSSVPIIIGGELSGLEALLGLLSRLPAAAREFFDLKVEVSVRD